jgi:hypothetical protein
MSYRLILSTAVPVNRASLPPFIVISIGGYVASTSFSVRIVPTDCGSSGE